MKLSPEDRFAIRDLTQEYVRCFDNFLDDEWADLFTPEGVFLEVGVREVIGTAGLRDMVRQAQQNAPGIRHLTMNDIATATEQGAHGTSTVLAVRVIDRSFRLYNAGLYMDEYVRTDDGWKFGHRTFATWNHAEDVDRAFVMVGGPDAIPG